MQLSTEFKHKVIKALLASRANYSGSDAAFSTSMGINSSIFNRIKKGETDRIISETKWLSLGRELDVSPKANSWKVAETAVYTSINEYINQCKAFSLSMILVDECGIGKTFCSKHIVRNMENAFYIDCSQCKTKQQFIRQLAKTIGVDNRGRFVDVKSNLKYYLNMLTMPVIVVDEAGDLDYPAFLELKEMWNGTTCGWFMMGADGLKDKIQRGINRKKVGYAEMFSRFSDEFISMVPNGKEDKQAFYSDLIGDVANANLQDKSKINQMIKQCLSKEATLRYLTTLITVNAA